MEFFGNIIKGIMIGIANIIPGVSGGTMAVSLGIYDRLIGSISGLFREFKKSILFLIPIIIGAGIGIVGFTYAIEYLLDKHTFVTCMAFVGLILGGLPAIFSSMRAKVSSGGVGVFGILAFVIAFAISGGMPLLKESKDALTVIAVTPGNMVILFILGIVASATMVIPGVSGSMMLMIFGYYYAIINTIKTFLDNLRAFDLAGMKDGILLLAPFGIGVALGIFLIEARLPVTVGDLIWNRPHGCRGFRYGICGRAVNKKDRLREMIGKISYAHRRSFYTVYLVPVPQDRSRHCEIAYS